MELGGIAEGMENLSAYTILHLLAENPTARGLNVQWAFNDVEDGGWAKRSDFVKPVDQSSRFLIVTAGSSDAAIIGKAFRLLRPHVADFFDFVDMEEGYPFSGTGNVFRFVQGLISIRVLNNVIVVYDNDAEGAANFERTRQLNLPANVVVIKLPELACFEAFPTVGPNGQHLANINNRAAAIECYLDLPPDASVRWSSYNARIGAYQGELVEKERYARAFLDQRGRSTGFPVAEHAEAMAGSDEEILKWYCFWIATRTQLLGARRPSTKIEPVNITDPPKDFVVAGNVLTLRERNRPVVWENLRIKVDELPKAIEQLKALAGEHAGNM